MKNVEKGEHEIKVCVDNTFTEASALHIPNDYYTYGGITRPVALENIADVYVKYIHFAPYMTENKWFAKIEVVVCNVSDMDIMQDMGVNALRTCHYPNDERMLNLCDERGIMVWEENHARGL